MDNKTHRELITAVASVIDPRDGSEFPGTKAEAVQAMLDWAADVRAVMADDDRTRRTLAGHLAHAQADRVAEMLAATLLHHLNEMDTIAGDTGLW